MPSKRAVFYHPELDIVRFTAFLLVFLSHVVWNQQNGFHRTGSPFVDGIFGGLFRGGIYGVDLFFALSSYLITELLLREVRERGTLHVRAFYTRRILRIWPLYFFFLLGVRPLYAVLFPAREHFGGGYIAAYLLLSGNWACVLWGMPLSVAAPLWSVSIEEQFYLAWPLVMKRFTRYLPHVAVGLLILANLARVLAAALHVDMWANTFTQLDPIAAGALLAFYLRGGTPRLIWPYRLACLACGAGLVILAGRFGQMEGWVGLLTYPAVAFASLLLIAATLVPPGAWKPGRLSGPLVYLGKISYGLYVFHVLAMELAGRLPLPQRFALTVRAVTAFALCFCFSVLSYNLIEKPFLRLKRRFTYVRSREAEETRALSRV